MRWLLYAVGAFFCWGCLALVSTYLLGHGVDVIVYLFYLTGIVSALMVVESSLGTVASLVPPGASLALLGAIGAASTLFNLSIQVGYRLAPNPGYINAANAASISLLTLASAYFFKDELTRRKVTGVLGVTAGLILLFV